MMGKFASGELIINEDEQGRADDLDTLIPKLVDEAITSFLGAGLLEGDAEPSATEG